MIHLKILFILSISQMNNATPASGYHSLKNFPTLSKGKIQSTNPTLKEIVQALEKHIVFWEKANKEEIASNLNVSVEKVKSVSEAELNEIRLDNIWLYENMIRSLGDGKAEFKIISTEGNSFEISFKEKAEDSLAIIMYFKYENDNLIVDKKK